MTRQERFEQIWSDFHAVPAESLVQYRWITQDGYRLPDMAAHYRTFCATLDSVVIELPAATVSMFSTSRDARAAQEGLDMARGAITAAGLKVSS